MNARAQKGGSELARVERIRTALERIAPGDGLEPCWQMVADENGFFVESRRQGELPVELARGGRFASADEISFMADAPSDMAFLLRLFDRAMAAGLAMRAHGAAKNHSAEAAMKCQEPDFQTFLAERHGLEPPLTDERAAEALRRLLGVTSRREINEGGAALERWKAIRAEFNEWRTG